MIINKKELKDKEAILYKVKSKRAILPILNTYLIDKDTITATDLEHTLTFKLDTKNDDTFCIEADRLHKFLSKIDSETIEITADEQFIKINGDVSIRLNNDYPPKDYPMIPGIEIQNIATTTLENLKELMKYVYKAVSRDETRPTLTGIHWDFSNGTLTAKATDSYRVYIKKCNAINNSQKDFNFLVEGKIYTIFKNLKGNNIVISKGKTFISFVGDDFNLTTRLINYDFPNTKMLFEDNSFNYVYEINVKDLTETVKKLIPYTNWNSPNHRASLKFDDTFRTLTLNLKSSDELISKDIKIDTLKSDGSFEIGLNFKFLLEAVENLTDEYIYLKCIDDLKPIWIIPARTDFKALIMPIKQS